MVAISNFPGIFFLLLKISLFLPSTMLNPSFHLFDFLFEGEEKTENKKAVIDVA